MNRREKIKVLHAIQQGILKPEDISCNVSPVFIQDQDGKGWSDFKRQYTNQEFELIQSQNEASNQRKILAGLEPVRLVLIIPQQGCVPIKD